MGGKREKSSSLPVGLWAESAIKGRTKNRGIQKLACLPDLGPGALCRILPRNQLTVITISDHHTRVSTGGGAQEAGGRVIGLLFGSQNGLDVSIYDAMEVACSPVGAGDLELNEAVVEKQKDLCEFPLPRRPTPPPSHPRSVYGVASEIV